MYNERRRSEKIVTSNNRFRSGTERHKGRYIHREIGGRQTWD
jgi:hypothetical protein